MGLFSFFFKKSSGSSATGSGSGYIILNIIRFCNVVCLLSCLASSSVMLVKTFIVSKFFFFDATSHIFTGILAIMLTITETPLFRKYFMHNWPLLSIASGFVTLGVLMVALGTLILGNLNKEATSEDSLGTSFWQLLISSGIITCIFGIINIVVNYIFRKRKFNITARMVRAYGAAASQHVSDIYASGPANRGADAYNEWHEKTVVPSSQPSYDNMNANYEAGQTVHRAPSVAPSTVPSYYGSQNGNSMKKTPSVVYGELGGPYARSATPMSRASTQRTQWPRFPVRSISAPINNNDEQFDKFKNAQDIHKPDNAAHPAFKGDANNWV